ncbi:uncharacterized protein LOC143038629 [Oratosquilla oratoria]|uniref:uncharacterized protein LOC143038629 n=1 Tax=Oratosquilla oratoria TaxID=337810 RepID=UPI003F76931B
MYTLLHCLLLLIPVFNFHTLCYAINCYECVHNNQRVKRTHGYVYPCSEFDGSSRYIVKCPASQMCVYQRITLKFSTNNVVSVNTMDGCTPNRSVQTRYAEAGLVEEGCIQHTSHYSPPSSEYCYCSTDLCNTAALPISLHHAIIGSSLLLALTINPSLYLL